MANKRRLIVNEEIRSPIAETFRTLRSNIGFSKAEGELKTILFTSAGPGEGKSTVIANTAIAMAQAERKVLLMDCDLRKPVQHRIFGLQDKGISNAVAEGIPVESLIQKTYIKNLFVLSSGPTPPNPSELLGSQKMRQILEAQAKCFDIILIDASPVVAVTDASVLATRVDGVILVVSAGANRPEMVQKARDLLLSAHAHIIGAVLNRAEIEEEQAYYYYYGNTPAKSG